MYHQDLRALHYELENGWRVKASAAVNQHQTNQPNCKPKMHGMTLILQDFPAFADLPASVRKEGIFGKIFGEYLADYYDIRRITMIFVPGWPTEPGQEITEQVLLELICGFVISSFPVARLEILGQQSMATW